MKKTYSKGLVRVLLVLVLYGWACLTGALFGKFWFLHFLTVAILTLLTVFLFPETFLRRRE